VTYFTVNPFFRAASAIISDWFGGTTCVVQSLEQDVPIGDLLPFYDLRK
jgi:hypothetical protein